MIMDNNTKQFVEIVHQKFPHFYISTFPYVGKLDDNDDVATILQKVYMAGVESGNQQGKNELRSEIKNLLNINDDN